MTELLLELLARCGLLVKSGERSRWWCEEHHDFCPPVWYRPRPKGRQRAGEGGS